MEKMKDLKRFRMLGVFVVVVVLSVATNLTTNYVVQKTNNDFEEESVKIPAAYAKFASATSAFETDFTLAADLSIHAVVHVKTKTPVKNQMYGGGFSDPFFEYFFGKPQQSQPQEAPMQEGSGSGVIISNDGYIVTNNHVVDNSKEIEVTLNDNRSFKAKLIGADPNTDIALIKIEAENLPVIIFGNSDSLRVGEWVLAVGNPFNLTSTVTAGIVSAKARNINIINSQMKIESFIQTDAAVNPGNSGGALVNTRGELVGINTAIASQTGSYAGYAFAVPVSIVQKVVADIQKFGIVQRAILGVEISDINSKLAKEKNLKVSSGVFVGKVNESSAAQIAGIKEGDIITIVNNVMVKSVAELQEQISKYRPGDKITVQILRDNSEKTLNVQLKNRQGSMDIVSVQDSQEVLGASFKDVNEKAKSQLGLSYGIEISSLTKGKLADAGIKASFIVLKVNNQPIRSAEDVKRIYNEVVNNADNNDKALYIAGVYPNGKIMYYAINLSQS